ncbi:MAG: isochorismate synthase [Pseudomonadota bacterium]
MIDWRRATDELARLAAHAAPARLLSVTLPLPRWPEIDPAAAGDWCVWRRPEQGLRLAGAGMAFHAESTGEGRFAALHAAQRGLAEGWRFASGTPRAFLGFAFAPQGGAPLPNARLWVPELLCAEQDGRTTLTLSCAAGEADAAPARWRALWRKMTEPAAVPAGLTFSILPNPLAEEAFLARGRAALAAIARGGIDKLVLTRALRLAGDFAQVSGPLLDALAARHPACATFGVGQGDHGDWSFVGASPEILLAAAGERVAVDALAGTAWQASARALGDEKNRREHDFVARAVAAALAGLCDDIAVPAEPEVMRVDTLTHLRRRVTARRPAGTGALDLVARLHPTPAVGGAPTPAALDWLARHGEARAAWYTGGIGWIDAAGDCDIAVALRCGLFTAGAATLQAGAGFVAGSDPEQELAETGAKLAALLDALAALPAVAAREEAAA